MSKLSLVVYIISLFAASYWCAEFRQERAKVKHVNPKYMQDLVVFTGRRSRRDPYLTNMTGTLMMPYGNNVTLGLVLHMQTGGEFKIYAKVCDAHKSKWMLEFTSKYSNLTVSCPFAAGRYRYMNMELPPRNIPFPVIEGDHYFDMVLFVTDTKEPIAEVSTLLHYDQNSRKNLEDKRGKQKDKERKDKKDKVIAFY